MSGIRLNNRQRPRVIDEIDDTGIKRQMKRWVAEFEELEKAFKKFQTDADAFISLNGELNRAAGAKMNDRATPGQMREYLLELVDKTSGVADAVNRILR